MNDDFLHVKCRADFDPISHHKIISPYHEQPNDIG